MKKHLITLLAVLLSLSAFSQNKAEVKIMMRNGDVVSGTSTLGNLVLNTDYGRLDIPLTHVTTVRFGILAEKGIESKVKEQLVKLSDQSEPIRKSAYEELIKFSVGAVPVIQQFIDSRTEETVTYTDYNAEMALNELQYLFNLEGMPDSKDRVVMDGEYEMAGTTNLVSIKLTTAYGNIEVSRDKMESVEIFCASPDNAEKIFKLQASKNISSNANGGWLKTGVMLKENQSFSISASGEIILASLSNQKYTPDGVASSGASDDYNDGYSNAGSLTYGSLVYKIGENGQTLKAGAKFTGKAKGKGMLYISIYETVYNSANSGSYTVRIKN